MRIRNYQDARLKAMAGLVDSQDRLKAASKQLVDLTAELASLLHADTSGVIGSSSKSEGEALEPSRMGEDRPGAVL